MLLWKVYASGHQSLMYAYNSIIKSPKSTKKDASDIFTMEAGAREGAGKSLPLIIKNMRLTWS